MDIRKELKNVSRKISDILVEIELLEAFGIEEDAPSELSRCYKELAKQFEIANSKVVYHKNNYKKESA